MLLYTERWLSRSIHAKDSWEEDRVTTHLIPATPIARSDADVVSRCRLTCLFKSMWGKRGELQACGAHPVNVGIRHATGCRTFGAQIVCWHGTGRFQPFCSQAADPFRNKPCSVGPASLPKRSEGVHERLVNCDVQQEPRCMCEERLPSRVHG